MRRLQHTASVPCQRSNELQYRHRSHGCLAGSSGIKNPFSQAVSAIQPFSTFVLLLAGLSGTGRNGIRLLVFPHAFGIMRADFTAQCVACCLLLQPRHCYWRRHRSWRKAFSNSHYLVDQLAGRSLITTQCRGRACSSLPPQALPASEPFRSWCGGPPDAG